MQEKTPPSRARLLLILPLVLLLWLGLRNHPDPVWLKADQLLRQECRLLQDAPDSLRMLLRHAHGATPYVESADVLGLISKPYMSNIEWTGFRKFFYTAYDRRFTVASGVTGAGTTKLARRAARLIALDEENILEIDCAPQFDLEYNKKYIGKEEDGRFEPGLMLQFWDRCRQYPHQKMVAVIDNFDKINPETFFGPELWESLSSPQDTAVLGGRKVTIPDNFYLISVTHLGPGSLMEMNEEHFKRLGRQYIVEPNPLELIGHLRRQSEKSETAGATAALLRDTAQMRRALFYFLKANEIISERYTVGHQLGQGSNARSFFSDKDLPELKNTFINHVNALRPARPFTEKDFKPLDYTVQSGGLEANSNFIARQVQFLFDTGYFVEITMVAATALITFLAGWWVFRRRERLMRHYGEHTREIFAAFETQELSADEAYRRLEGIKREVDNLVLRRSLNYTEGLYFLAFIEDKVRRIEFARNVSENFLSLFNTFMEDDVLTENEYQKLSQFLESIQHKIPEEVYLQYKEKVERAYSGELEEE